jgi:hypothetical protein
MSFDPAQMRACNLRLAEISCVFLWALVLERPPNKSQTPNVNHADQCMPTVRPKGEKKTCCSSFTAFFFVVVPFLVARGIKRMKMTRLDNSDSNAKMVHTEKY